LNNGKILIIDDDKSICKTLKLHFEHHGCEVTTTYTASEGLRALDALPSGIVILDIKLPDANGIDILKEIRKRGDSYYSIMVTAYPDMESTIKAVQSGVGEYIHKPIDIQELDNAVKKGFHFFSNIKDPTNKFIEVPKYNFNIFHFIGKSAIMKELFKTVGMVSLSKATVHITGESGTGKELVAKATHQNSRDKNAPFISVNCSAIVDTLLESELFGHVKGSFTGAIHTKEGKFSLAKNGTIFLDEISEMSMNLQAKLLRVLQEREFEMVGGKEKLRAECRIISATNNNLEQLVKEGKFREDLFYRVKVITINIPPLRDRREDIPELALYFLANTNREINRNVKYISKAAIDYLVARPWPGNVRELENTITHASAMSQDDRLTVEDFMAVAGKKEKSEFQPSTVAETGGDNGSPFYQDDGFRPKSINELEKEQIYNTLQYTKWHKGKTCGILGISRPRLDRKIRKYGIRPA